MKETVWNCMELARQLKWLFFLLTRKRNGVTIPSRRRKDGEKDVENKDEEDKEERKRSINVRAS